jgi:hypothetical protein
MEGDHRRCQVLHTQARELVHIVFTYFKCEADAGMPVHGITKAQKRSAEAYDISIESVQRITSEGKVTI